jgi:hypothetical protein
MEARGEVGCYDLIGDGIVVELSRSSAGDWTFWAVRFEGSEDRIGNIERITNPAAVARLDAAARGASSRE